MLLKWCVHVLYVLYSRLMESVDINEISLRIRLIVMAVNHLQNPAGNFRQKKEWKTLLHLRQLCKSKASEWAIVDSEVSCLTDRNKYLGDVIDLASKKRRRRRRSAWWMHTTELVLIQTDLGDAVDVRMSHTFSLTCSLYHQQHKHDMWWEWQHTQYQ